MPQRKSLDPGAVPRHRWASPNESRVAHCLVRLAARRPVALSPVVSTANPPAGPAEVRVQAEFIEVSLAQCDYLLFGDHAPATDGELRQQVGQLVAHGQATMVETPATVAISGHKATTESIREFIYPTEVEPPATPTEVRSAAGDRKPALQPRDFAVGPT